jgi:hypothetical protein
MFIVFGRSEYYEIFWDVFHEEVFSEVSRNLAAGSYLKSPSFFVEVFLFENLPPEVRFVIRSCWFRIR